MPKLIRECCNHPVECPGERQVRTPETNDEFQDAGPPVAFGQYKIQSNGGNAFAEHFGPFELLRGHRGIFQQMEQMLVVHPFNEQVRQNNKGPRPGPSRSVKGLLRPC